MLMPKPFPLMLLLQEFSESELTRSSEENAIDSYLACRAQMGKVDTLMLMVENNYQHHNHNPKSTYPTTE
jgi:hypothetical protein